MNLIRDLLVALGSLGLAALTYVFVENPIRRRKPWPFSGAWQTVAVGTGMSLAVAGLALSLYVQADAAARHDPWLTAIYAARNSVVASPPNCHLMRFGGLPPAQACRIGAAEAPPRILLWGDSHAEHFVETIREDGARNGYAAIARTMSACAPLLRGRRKDCQAFNEALAREIPALVHGGVTGIIISSRNYGFPVAPATVGDVTAWKEQLREVLAMARRSRLRVIVIAPVPTYRTPVPECLAYLPAERCGIDRVDLDRTRAPLVSALGQVVAEFENARLWDPLPSFCDDRTCTPVHEGVILYSDLSHLSVLGSRSLVPAAAPYLAWLIH